MNGKFDWRRSGWGYSLLFLSVAAAVLVGGIVWAIKSSDSYDRQLWLTMLLSGVAMLIAGFAFSLHRTMSEKWKLLAGAGLIVLLAPAVARCIALPKPLYRPPDFTEKSTPDIRLFFNQTHMHWPEEFMLVTAAAAAIFAYALLCGLIAGHFSKKGFSSFLIGLLLFLLTAPLLSGMAAALSLWLLPSDDWHMFIRSDYPLPYLLGFIPAVPLLLIWKIKLTRDARIHSMKSLFRGLLLLFALSISSYLAANVAVYLRAGRVLTLAKRDQRDLRLRIFAGERNAMIARRLRRRMDDWTTVQGKSIYYLPLDSSYEWLAEPGKGLNEAQKQLAIQAFRSKPAQDFLAAVLQLKAEDRMPVDDGYFMEYYLNFWASGRQALRLICGMAALHHYLGEPDRVLPLLKDYGLPITHLLSCMGPWLLEYTCSEYAVFRWASTVVQLGPDGPEYGNDYREILNDLVKNDVPMPDELELYATYLRQAMDGSTALYYHLHMDKPVPWYQRIFVISYAYRSVLSRLDFQKKFELLQKSSKIEVGPKPSSLFDSLALTMRNGKSRRNRSITLVALKLYRSLHGEYPESLPMLSPDILPVIPTDPYTGKPFPYSKKGSGFLLEYHSSEGKTDTVSNSPKY